MWATAEGLHFPLPGGDETASHITWRQAKEATGSCTAPHRSPVRRTTREGKPLGKGVCVWLKLLFSGNNGVRDYFPGTEALCWSRLFIRWFTATKHTQVLIYPRFSYIKVKPWMRNARTHFIFLMTKKSVKDYGNLVFFFILVNWITSVLLF